jgi:lipoyl(octanoyl) transferase
VPELNVRRLGCVAYADALALQAELVVSRREGAIPDTLLLLEHPPVITLGSSSDKAHVLADMDERATRGIELFETGRGGDVTYHGPGQLVAYPILDLKPDRQDLHQYLRDLEAVLVSTAAAFGVAAERREGYTGVWTPSGKLAAIGVRVSSGWITSHGVALNVATDLSYFDTIVPCGLLDRNVTSLEREVGCSVTVEEASGAFVEAFLGMFT